MLRRVYLHLWLVILWLPSTLSAKTLQQAKPWIGVAIEKGAEGVLVKSILPGTPAEMAGLNAGDEILMIEQEKVQTPEQLIHAVAQKGVGATVTLKFLRQKKELQKTLKLEAKPDDLDLLRKRLVDQPAPPLFLTTDEKSKTVLPYDFKGKVTILEFWATWCPACRGTHARLSRLAQNYPEKDLKVLAVSDEDPATVRKYMQDSKFKFSAATSDPAKIQSQWLATAIPLIVGIDRGGIVRFATIGGGPYLEEAIQWAEKELRKP